MPMSHTVAVLFVLLVGVAMVTPSSSAAVVEILLRNATTVAGVYGVQGTLDGPVGTATTSGPAAVCVDPTTGDIFIGDNELIRRVREGTVKTMFGLPGVFGLVDGNANTSRLNNPTSMVAVGGYVYVVEPRNNVVRRFNSTNIEGFAGSPSGFAGFNDGTGSLATFLNPTSITYSVVDDAFYVTDNGNAALRKISRTGAVTTASLSVTSPFYASASGSGTVLVLHRPTSSTVGVYSYFVSNNSAAVFLPVAPFAFVAIGHDVVSNRIFCVTATRVYELYTNGTVSLVAGLGASYLDGPNPRFNFVNNMFVDSFRNIYLTSGPLAYVVRRLFFDPPPPVPVTLTLPSAYFLPLDNVTALNRSVTILEAELNALLGTNGTTTVDIRSFQFSRVLEGWSTNVTVFVANASYTNSTPELINAAVYASLAADLEQYYNPTRVYDVLLDPLRIPFLLAALGSSSTSPSIDDALQTLILRNRLETEVRSALGNYSYFVVRGPYWTSNSTDGANVTRWQLLLPPSFANASTTAALRQIVYHAPLYDYAASLYAPDLFVDFSALRYQLPLSNASAMYLIRLAIQQDIERALWYSPVGVDLPTAVVVGPASINATRFRVLLQNSTVSNLSGVNGTGTLDNATALLANITWTSVDSVLLDLYGSTVFVRNFDSTKFPWSDRLASRDILLLLQRELNRQLASDANANYVQVTADGPVTTLQADGRGTVTYSIRIPQSLQGVTTNATQLALEDSPLWPIDAYIASYYRASSSQFVASFPALGLPVFNSTAMEELRVAVGVDLARMLEFANVGANATNVSLASLGIRGMNGNDSTILSTTGVVTFPLLFPASFVNTSTVYALGNGTFSGTMAKLATLVSAVDAVLPVGLLPIGNATALELLRIALTRELRFLVNSSSTSSPPPTTSHVQVGPLLQNQGDLSSVALRAYFPVGSVPADLNLTDLVLRLVTDLQSPVGTVGSSLSSYYVTSYAVSLPFDLTPWSNATVMDEAVIPRLLIDIRGALVSQSVTTADIAAQVLINTSLSVVVSRVDPPRSVEFQVLLPPDLGGSGSVPLPAVHTALTTAPLTHTRQYLAEYFPKNLTLVADAASLPWSDEDAMRTISVLLANFLADHVFLFENVGLNSSVYRPTSDTVTFKIIVPPSFDNATTRANLTSLGNPFDPTTLGDISSFLSSWFPSNFYATFAGTVLFPYSNSTAMSEMRRRLLLDLTELFQFSNVGVESPINVVDNNTGASYTAFPLLLPPSFANSTTVALLTAPTYSRVMSYLAAFYATPSPPTPAPTFLFLSRWPSAALPTFNNTQMEMLAAALLQDVKNTLYETDVTVGTWQYSSDGSNVEFPVTLPAHSNNATTGTLLNDVTNYPLFQQLLASINQGNLLGIETLSAAVNEGCSRGCVIGVAAVGAVVATAGVVGAIVYSSRKRHPTGGRVTVMAPRGHVPQFSPVFEEGDIEEDHKNPLDLK